MLYNTIIMAPLINLSGLAFLNDFLFFLPLKMLSWVVCVVRFFPSKPSTKLSTSLKASIFSFQVSESVFYLGEGH